MSLSTSSTLLVTGAAGFIGANFVMDWLRQEGGTVVSLDKLTYAGNRANLASLDNDTRHIFVHGDIGDANMVARLLRDHRPTAIVNFAAESHVDRSINSPEDFVQTNIVSTMRLLQATRVYVDELSETQKDKFRFLHISTDEVYGSLLPNDSAFTETTPSQPNSPYAASKASSDHLVRAWHHTYGLPVLTTNCSNNYGPLQFPEKLIPLMIHNALAGKALPVYGDGQNVRDWLYVGDHCSALRRVLQAGRVGETYNVGGNSEAKNIDVVHILCDILDQKKPRSDGKSYRAQIAFVTDRPGHDRRYAINADKIARELDWKPTESFASGLNKTVQWYLDHQDWVHNVTSGAYRQWITTNYETGLRAI